MLVDRDTLLFFDSSCLIAAGLSIVALSPGGFITTILPTHLDYPSIR
jgi:hypothetical protein